MTVKRSLGIGFLVIVLLNVLTIGSEVALNMKVKESATVRDKILDLKLQFDTKVLEHNNWSDKVAEHVMDGWPFEGSLESEKDPLLTWLGRLGVRHGHDHERSMIKVMGQMVQGQYAIAASIVESGSLEAKRATFLNEFLFPVQNLKPQTALFVRHYDEEMVKLNQHLYKLEKISRYLKVSASGITIALIIAFFLLLETSLIKPLTTISKSIVAIGQGDLSKKIEYDKQNEIREITDSFNTMTGSFVEIIRKIIGTSETIARSVEDVKDKATQSSEASKAQADKASQIAITSEQMSQTMIDIASSAANAASSSGKAMELAKSGMNAANETKEREDRVFESTVKLSSMMDRLSNKAGEISSIVDMINDIADQTNLLALNAAIEAARAGEHGRGFGVVADEVRKLAERTLGATSEISGNINEVLNEISSTNESMGEVTSEIMEVTKGIKNLDSMLGEIVAAVENVTDMVSQIASAVEEQSSATEHVNIEIEESSKLSQLIDSMASDVLGHINGLSSVAQDLRDSINRFKV